MHGGSEKPTASGSPPQSNVTQPTTKNQVHLPAQTAGLPLAQSLPLAQPINVVPVHPAAQATQSTTTTAQADQSINFAQAGPTKTHLHIPGQAHTSNNSTPTPVHELVQPRLHTTMRMSGLPQQSSTHFIMDHFPPLAKQRTEGLRLTGTSSAPKVAVQPPAILLNPAAASQPHKSFLNTATGTSAPIPKIAPK